MKTFVVTVTIIYVCFSGLLYLFQRSFLYYPQPGITISGAVPQVFDSNGTQLNGWIVNPGRDKALIYYGGNAEQIEQNVEFFLTLLPDYSVYLIPYRGYGGNPDSPTELKLYQDALAIYEIVAQGHGEISLMGRSLGSGVATYIASNRAVANLILVTPYDSIENVAKSTFWMFPVSFLLQDKFLSWQHVQSVETNTLVIIAEHDSVIPRHHSDNLIRYINREYLDVVVIPNTDHNDISLHREFAESVRSTLR